MSYYPTSGERGLVKFITSQTDLIKGVHSDVDQSHETQTQAPLELDEKERNMRDFGAK